MLLIHRWAMNVCPKNAFMSNEKVGFDPQELLALLPQTAPFRFVDKVLEIDERHVLSSYRFRGDEFFYTGHFPGDPVTPGVILLEAMAQGGVVLQALFLTSQSDAAAGRKLSTVLTDLELEIYRPVVPPENVTIHGELLLWRGRKIRSQVKMFNERNDLIATAKIAGMGMLRE